MNFSEADIRSKSFLLERSVVPISEDVACYAALYPHISFASILEFGRFCGTVSSIQQVLYSSNDVDKAIEWCSQDPEGPDRFNKWFATVAFEESDMSKWWQEHYLSEAIPWLREGMIDRFYHEEYDGGVDIYGSGPAGFIDVFVADIIE